MTSDHAKSLRVMQVVRSAVYGGVENHVYELCRHLKEIGVEVILVSLVDREVRADFGGLGIRIEKLHDSESWSARVLGSVFDLRKLVVDLRPDILHLHGIRPTLVGSIAGKLARRRMATISTLHGAYSLMAIGSDGWPSPLLLSLAKLFHWIGFSLSDRVLVDCERLLDEVREVYRWTSLDVERVLRRKVRVAYNGVDLRPFARLPGCAGFREAMGISDDALLIGTVSRLDEPAKGIGVFLRAARMVLERHPDAHFVITGEGWSRPSLEALAVKLGINSRVHFMGYWKDVLEVFQALNVFVLPSLSEGFPTVNLEAMAAGLPVVTTDVGGSAEAVRDGVCGIVVPPRDEIKLAEAINRLCGDASLRHLMGKKGKEAVFQHFGSNATAARVLEVYREVSAPWLSGGSV